MDAFIMAMLTRDLLMGNLNFLPVGHTAFCPCLTKMGLAVRKFALQSILSQSLVALASSWVFIHVITDCLYYHNHTHRTIMTWFRAPYTAIRVVSPTLSATSPNGCSKTSLAGSTTAVHQCWACWLTPFVIRSRTAVSKERFSTSKGIQGSTFSPSPLYNCSWCDRDCRCLSPLSKRHMQSCWLQDIFWACAGGRQVKVPACTSVEVVQKLFWIGWRRKERSWVWMRLAKAWFWVGLTILRK